MSACDGGPVRILLVEDNPGDARLLREVLRDAEEFDFALHHVPRLADAQARAAGDGADVVLLDLSLPDAHGMETVERMLAAAPDIPIVVLTGLADERVAVAAVQAGAQDYLVKGATEAPVLVRAIRYAIERKRLDCERRDLLARERAARAQAEAAVRARDDVLGVVAHDLGNSLSAVLVTTTVVLRTLPDDPALAPTRERVAAIRSLAEGMQRLRQDLLDVASMEAGRLAMDLDAVDPAPVLRAAGEALGPLAAEKDVSLSVDVPDALPTVLADGARIGQVVGNLLGNAVKFTPAGGSVRLSATEGDDAVEVTVADTGPGIDADHLPHVFDRFWKTNRANRHGAGLGLAIARGIVDAHGGAIDVASTPGQGTTFRVTLPLWRGE